MTLACRPSWRNRANENLPVTCVFRHVTSRQHVKLNKGERRPTPHVHENELLVKHSTTKRPIDPPEGETNRIEI